MLWQNQFYSIIPGQREVQGLKREAAGNPDNGRELADLQDEGMHQIGQPQIVRNSRFHIQLYVNYV